MAELRPCIVHIPEKEESYSKVDFLKKTLDKRHSLKGKEPQ